jgi:hypothetical protein
VDISFNYFQKITADGTIPRDITRRRGPVAESAIDPSGGMQPRMDTDALDFKYSAPAKG